MKFIIVSGMSGAGKSTALKMLEDMGFFCVDNLPVQLIRTFAEVAYNRETEVDNVAIGVDIRSGELLGKLTAYLDELEEHGFPYEILFLEANNDTLVKRYKETRRSHPLVHGGRVEQGIDIERRKVHFLKEKASYIIDTSTLLTRELKIELEKIFVKNQSYSNFIVTVLSFGFKYGIPTDSDLVFDVRFLPNPYYVPELKALTGNDRAIQDFVLKSTEAMEFLSMLNKMITFLIPNYIKEGKNQLVISIGCTGGKHRSVTIVNELYKALSELEYSVKFEHRDIQKDVITKQQ